MKFEEAFDIALEKESHQSKGHGYTGAKVSVQTAKTLAFLWNMLAASQNVLDDFAFIVDNNGTIDIKSIPIDIAQEKKGKKQKPPKVDNADPVTTEDAANGEEEETATEPEQSTEQE